MGENNSLCRKRKLRDTTTNQRGNEGRRGRSWYCRTTVRARATTRRELGCRSSGVERSREVVRGLHAPRKKCFVAMQHICKKAQQVGAANLFRCTRKEITWSEMLDRTDITNV